MSRGDEMLLVPALGQSNLGVCESTISGDFLRLLVRIARLDEEPLYPLAGQSQPALKAAPIQVFILINVYMASTPGENKGCPATTPSAPTPSAPTLTPRRYAVLWVEQDLVAIVEPELLILMDSSHTIDSFALTELALEGLYDERYDQRVQGTAGRRHESPSSRRS